MSSALPGTSPPSPPASRLAPQPPSCAAATVISASSLTARSATARTSAATAKTTADSARDTATATPMATQLRSKKSRTTAPVCPPRPPTAACGTQCSTSPSAPLRVRGLVWQPLCRHHHNHAGQERGTARKARRGRSKKGVISPTWLCQAVALRTDPACYLQLTSCSMTRLRPTAPAGSPGNMSYAGCWSPGLSFLACSPGSSVSFAAGVRRPFPVVARWIMDGC